MYGFVPYNLSPIQQGIQFGHAVQEYNNLMMALSTEVKANNLMMVLSTEVKAAERAAFDAWRKCDKTFIILNGGTTNSNPERIGTLNKTLIELTDAGVLCASFREPDLGDQLTAFVFIVDDRAFDRETWPNYDGPWYSSGQPEATAYWHWKMKFAETETETEKEADQIVFLRDYLRNFKLA
jgi:hypothetical protein